MGIPLFHALLCTLPLHWDAGEAIIGTLAGLGAMSRLSVTSAPGLLCWAAHARGPCSKKGLLPLCAGLPSVEERLGRQLTQVRETMRTLHMMLPAAFHLALEAAFKLALAHSARRR